MAESCHDGIDEGYRFAQYCVNALTYFLLQCTDLYGWHGGTGPLMKPPWHRRMAKVVPDGFEHLSCHCIQIPPSKLQHPSQATGVRQTINSIAVFTWM
jgi:hypothetical protein